MVLIGASITAGFSFFTAKSSSEQMTNLFDSLQGTQEPWNLPLGSARWCVSPTDSDLLECPAVDGDSVDTAHFVGGVCLAGISACLIVAALFIIRARKAKL